MAALDKQDLSEVGSGFFVWVRSAAIHETPSMLAKRENFPSKASLEFVEMWRKGCAFWVKSFCWHKSVKRRLTSSFAIFFDKKNGGCFFNDTRHSETHSSSKTQNFAVKWNCKNHFTFSQKNSEYVVLYENITRIGTQITINFQRWFSYFSFSME